MIPIYQVLVRRDANTITPSMVPEYEFALLQELFGAENVQNVDRRRVDEDGAGTPVGTFVASEDEYDRCSAKYGADVVEQIYGKKSAKTLQKAVDEIVKAGEEKAISEAKALALAAKKAQEKAEAEASARAEKEAREKADTDAGVKPEPDEKAKK